MATLQDIITTVPALLDDASTSVFDAAFILPYVNTVQRKISNFLMSASIKQAKFRQDSPMVVPATTTRIGRWREDTAQTAPNLVAYSKDFSVGATKWSVGAYDTPVVAAAQPDPLGGTTAGKWTFAAASLHEMTVTAALTIPSGTANQYCTVSIWIKTSSGVPYTAIVSAGFSSANETSQSVNVTANWQKVTVTTGPITTPGIVSGTLHIVFPALAGLVAEVAFPTITHTQEWLGYTATAGQALYATYPPCLPDNFVEPDELWEAKMGGTSQDFYRVVGPNPIPNQAQTNSLGYWDFYNGEIRLLGATEDRLLRIDYWGSLENFQGSLVPAQAVIMQGFVNPICFGVCQLISHSRGQHQAAAVWEGLYSTEMEQIANIQQKPQQQNPVRRLSSRGASRYQGNFRGVG